MSQHLYPMENSTMTPIKSSFPWNRPAVVIFALTAMSNHLFAQSTGNSDDERELATVSSDLQMIYGKTENASSVADYSAIVNFCRNIVGDSTRIKEDRQYARTLMSWAANKRGEARSDQAGRLVREEQFGQAKELDAMAKKDFETAIKLDHSRWRAHHNIAIIQALQGNNDAALESFETVIRLNPEFAVAYFNRGELYFRLNRFELAIEDQNKVIQIKPDDSNAYSARAHSLYALGKTEEALADYAKAMGLSPSSSDAATEYADTCQALGKWKQAATAYQRAMQLDGQNARTFQNAAWMMATCPDEFYRNGESALETAQKAVQLATGSASVHVLDVLAAAQAASGDFVSAQSTIAEAIRSTSDATLRSELQMRLRQYQRKRPYLQPSPVSKRK